MKWTPGSRPIFLALTGLASLGLLATLAAAAPQGKKPAGKARPNKALIAHGKKVYAKHNCATCHVIAGKGAKVGPELTKIAANPKHTAKWLEEVVVDPKKHFPNGTMPAYKDLIKGKDLKALVAYLASLK